MVRELHTWVHFIKNPFFTTKNGFFLFVKRGIVPSAALNHIYRGYKATDIYIAEDWAILDEVQSAFIALLSVSQNKCDKSLQSLVIQSPSADNIPAAKEQINIHTVILPGVRNYAARRGVEIY